jgi:hypothetical protein
MKLVGIMPCRNEDWILGLSLRAALLWCDEVVVGLHACTDDSAAIAFEAMKEHAGRVHVFEFPDGTWREMAHRQFLLSIARNQNATHIAMVDADEVLTGNLLSVPVYIRALIDQHCTPGTVLQLPWLALPRTLDRYITSGVWGPGQQVSMVFKDQPEAHWALHGGRDFHHRNPMGIGRAFRAPLKPEQGGLMHLQFLDERRLRAKQLLYKLTEMIRWPAPCQLEGRYCATQGDLAHELNRMYGRAVYESDPAKCETAPVPLEWWAPYAHLMRHLSFPRTPEGGGMMGAWYRGQEIPWQETECRRLIAEHGREKFAGLDLFSVV